MEAAVTEAGAQVTTATTDDDGPGRRLAIDARPDQANRATRFYARKWLDFYNIAPGIVPWLWRNVRRFDVVHIHALFSFSSIAAAIVARARGVPYIITAARYFDNLWYQPAAALAKALVACLHRGPNSSRFGGHAFYEQG